MQRIVSNWLCVSTVFYKKTKEKRLIFFFLPPAFTSDMSEKKNPADLEFYFYFFSSSDSHIWPKKSVKQKIKKLWPWGKGSRLMYDGKHIVTYHKPHWLGLINIIFVKCRLRLLSIRIKEV